jgi:alkylation response protein AidB-like acyl-CoA dehydrogenase
MDGGNRIGGGVTDLARDFATRAAAHDRDGSFPFENFAALQEAGLLSLTVPVELGGKGQGIRAIAETVGTIARGDPSTALVLLMQLLQQAAIARSTRWPAHLKRQVAREAVEHGALINALRVEPELGTPARGGLPATIARLVPEGWRLTGRKIYATGIPALRWGLVWARTDEPEPRMGFFLLPCTAAGVSVIESWDHLGMRATGSHDVLLEDVLLPADHAVDIRPPADWAVPDPRQAAGNTIGIAALYDGVARAARDWLVEYLKQRTPSNLGAPLASLPRFQQAIGEIDALLQANTALLARAIDAVERHPETADPAGLGLTKYTVTTNAIRAVEQGLALIGNPGLSRANPMERHYRDVLCSRIHTPQDDTALTAAGRAALGF